MNGTIKKLVTERGFGFITPEGETSDIFFHSSEVKDITYAELKEGDAVTFDKTEEGGRFKATSVKRA